MSRDDGSDREETEFMRLCAALGLMRKIQPEVDLDLIILLLVISSLAFSFSSILVLNNIIKSAFVTLLKAYLHLRSL